MKRAALIWIGVMAALIMPAGCTDDDITYDSDVAATLDLNEYVMFAPTVSSTTTRGSHTAEDLTHFGFTCSGRIEYDTVDVYKVAMIDLIWYVDSLMKNNYTSMELLDFYDSFTYNFNYSYYERDTVWLGDTVMRWNSNSSSEKLNYIAVTPYPYKDQKDFLSYQNPKTLKISVDSDQTAYSDLSNDLLLCKKTGVDPTTDLSAQGEVEIDFEHALAKLKVMVTLDTMFNTQYGMDELQKLYDEDSMTHIYATNATSYDIAAGKDTMKIGSYTVLTTESNPIRELSINGLNIEGTLDLSKDNPTVTDTASDNRIYLGYDSIWGYDKPLQWSEFAVATYEAIIVPQTVTVSDLTMSLVMGYYTYEYTFTDESFTFEGGNSYEIDLFLNPNEIDGTVTEIKPTSTKSDFTNIQVGDFLMSDGNWMENDSLEYYEGTETAIAIVFNLEQGRIGTQAKAKLTGYSSYGVAMSLKNCGDTTCDWSNDTTANTTLYNVAHGDYDTMEAQYDGYGNCDTIKKETGYSQETFPAFYAALNFSDLTAPDNTTGWYLPSAGEWIDFMKNLGDITLSTEVDEGYSYSYQVEAPTDTTISSSVFNDWMAPAGVDGYASFGWRDCFWSSTEMEISEHTDAYYAAAAYFTRSFNLTQMLTHSKVVDNEENGLTIWDHYGVTIPAMVRPAITFGYNTTSSAKGNTQISEERRVKSEKPLYKVKLSLPTNTIKATKW